MIDNLEEIYIRQGLYSFCWNSKKIYIRTKISKDVVEKIRYRIDAEDWSIYIDGKTIRSFVKGFAFCSSGIAFCDDCGQVYKLSIDELKKINVSFTDKCLMLHGRSVLLGGVSKQIAETLVKIKKELNVELVQNRTIKIANVAEEMWYVGYEGNIQGPFSHEELQSQIDIGNYMLNALQVWTSRMKSWELISTVNEFRLPIKDLELSKNKYVLDINSCSKSDLISIPGFSEKRVDIFLKKRDEGIYLKSIYDLQTEFNLSPHEIERLKSMIVFRVENEMKKGGRILDM